MFLHELKIFHLIWYVQLNDLILILRQNWKCIYFQITDLEIFEFISNNFLNLFLNHRFQVGTKKVDIQEKETLKGWHITSVSELNEYNLQRK